MEGDDLIENEESIGQTEEAIIGGLFIDVATRRANGLVDVGWSNYLDSAPPCSGAILDSRWVVTARGCATPPPASSGNFVVRAPKPDAGYDIRAVRSKIQLTDSSLVMLELESSTPTTWPTIVRTQYLGSPSGLQGKTINCYGRGDTSYIAGGSGGTIGWGPWKRLDRTVSSTDLDNVYFTADANGQNIVAVNDMGGPCFYNNLYIGAIQSVTQVCNPTCRNHTATIAASSPEYLDINALRDSLKTPFVTQVGPNYVGELSLTYKTWDTSPWCARAYGRRFAHAPNCSWLGDTSSGLARTAGMINYLGTDNIAWGATIKADGWFSHYPASDPSATHPDLIINYKYGNTSASSRIASKLKHTPSSGASHVSLYAHHLDWNGNPVCTTVHGKKFLRAANCNWDSGLAVSNVIQYRGHDNVNWQATVDGTVFTHTPQGNPGEVRVSTIVNYKAYDNTPWTMEVAQ